MIAARAVIVHAKNGSGCFFLLLSWRQSPCHHDKVDGNAGYCEGEQGFPRLWRLEEATELMISCGYENQQRWRAGYVIAWRKRRPRDPPIHVFAAHGNEIDAFHGCIDGYGYGRRVRETCVLRSSLQLGTMACSVLTT
ncbi:hypothetical protein GOP47_0010128 [Adiantum capillus-veneris]|uniref:Uncharacterized protein n=1 Tax=Adiantum capillus-veneris TaxID=13818 RepID=A0A9D4ZHH0_ADICA|nr:hypothetical protein GOP47_0010128 [Adiantum capillus-veneris]